MIVLCYVFVNIRILSIIVESLKYQINVKRVEEQRRSFREKGNLTFGRMIGKRCGKFKIILVVGRLIDHNVANLITKPTVESELEPLNASYVSINNSLWMKIMLLFSFKCSRTTIYVFIMFDMLILFLS